MSTNNLEAIVTQANAHIANINRLLKNAKSDVSADYIHFHIRGVIITTNEALAFSNLNVVERYVKELDNIDSNNIISPCLLQSKLYLKILEVSYFLENTNLLITSDVIEEVIKDIHIFNDIILASHSHIIKTSPKSNMAVIWINTWDSQNDMKAKDLINRYFNIGHHIATIRGTNMNSGISQCKNC